MAQTWILEADIHRLTKAFNDAPPEARAGIVPHLRRAQAALARTQSAGEPNDPEESTC